jgi:cobalt-zinc-cadmium efflux system outer membrane protein
MSWFTKALAAYLVGAALVAQAQDVPVRLEPGPLVPIPNHRISRAPLPQSTRPSALGNASTSRPQAAIETVRVHYNEIPPQPSPETIGDARQPHGAEPIEPGLSLADFEGMALSCNPSVARAAALVQAARGNWVQVGLKPNPSIGYEGQQLGSGGLAEQHGVFAQQEIVRGGKLRLNREVAAQEVARAERNLSMQQQRVLTDVRIAYYAVLVAQEQERLATDLLQIGEKSLDIANALFKAQEVARPDVLQSQIEIENAHIFSTNSRNRRASAWQSLITVVGQPEMPMQKLQGNPVEELPLLEFSGTLQRLLSSSPEVASAIANVERSRWALERARVESVPNVTLQGMVNVIDNGIGGKPDGNVMIGVPLPLWNKNQGGIIQAQGEVAAAERAVQQLELDLQNRLGPIFERYSNASNQVRRYQNRILPAAQESYELTRRSYEAGEVGFVSLLTAQRTFSQTRLSYLESVRELRTTAAQLEGYLLSDSLNAR